MTAGAGEPGTGDRAAFATPRLATRLGGAKAEGRAVLG
jgi:hypothetical protein